MRTYLFTMLPLFLLLIAGSAFAQAQEKIAVLFLAPAISEKAPGTTPLFLKRGYLPDETLQAHLANQGIVWEAETLSTKMTWDYLKQFNVIVLLGYPMLLEHDAYAPVLKEKEGLLARFIAEGGGVMLTLSSMWDLERDTEALNRFLKPYDAQVLSEQVVEKNLALTLPSLAPSALAWTGNVTKSPLTEGVRGLLYPSEHAWAYYTHPVQTGTAWQVLLRGTASASSFSVKLGSGDTTKRPGTYSSNPPMLAVRDSGKGRIVLWPTIPSATIIDGYHQFWYGGHIMEGTNQNLRSDGRKLLFNLLGWLAAPSKGQFGGYVPKPVDSGMGNESGFQTVDWDKVSLTGRTIPNAYRGLVGMQSNLSGGKNSPAEMIQAAKDAGYHFAAFTEDLSKLTAEKLETLRKLCADASSDTFQVYHGFRYFDESGNAWATFGRTVGWPKDDWWSKKRPGAITINNLIFRGFQYCPSILLTPNKNPEPAIFQGNFKNFAVYTYAGGKLLDDATATYQRLQGEFFDLYPMVVHQTASVAEVKAAAAAPFQCYTRWWELADVQSAFTGNYCVYKGMYIFHKPPFVSSGPVIEDFRVFNFGTADLAIPNNDRYRIRLWASAPRGLKEVAIYDGEALYRRFLLNGEKEWTVEVDGYQENEHHFLAVVTDTAGGKAISADRWTNQNEVGMVRCTDNINTYTGGKYMAVKFFALRGLESYIDRQAGSMTYFPRGLPSIERPAVEQRLSVVSRFGYIKDDVCEYSYPPTASPNWNHNDQPENAVPAEALTGGVRTTMFAPRASGTSVYLVEGDYTAVRDIELPQNYLMVYNGTWVKDAETLYISRADGTGYCKQFKQNSPYASGPFTGVEYVANMAPLGGSRAIVPLSPNLNYGLVYANGERTGMNVTVPIQEKRLRKGERFSYKYLAVWSTVNAVPDNSFIEEVYDKLGLRGKPAYTVAPAQGKVLDTRYILRLQAQDYGFAGKISEAKLPLDLPVTIDGLNPRWPAGILYKGRNELFVPTWRMDKVGNRYVENVKTPGENQLRRFAVFENAGLLQVDTETGGKDVYIGNLLTCNNPEIFLSLDDVRPGKAVITANNPNDKPVTCIIKPGPGFDLLGSFSKTVTLQPGGYERISL
ncbi:MAG: hypothetical protein ACYC7E_07970 [Armatimonadota bacterium]